MAIEMMRRMLHIPILHIDANLINARQKLASVNQLEHWFEQGVILINMSLTAHGESHAGNNEQRTRKAHQQIYTLTSPISCNDSLYRKVEDALFPAGAQGENQENDVKIVCTASEYGAILVTNDGGSKTQPGGMLGNREKIADFVRILSPDEAVAEVRSKIRERDDFNKRIASEFGGDLPPWTGSD